MTLMSLRDNSCPESSDYINQYCNNFILHLSCQLSRFVYQPLSRLMTASNNRVHYLQTVYRVHPLSSTVCVMRFTTRYIIFQVTVYRFDVSSLSYLNQIFCHLLCIIRIVWKLSWYSSKAQALLIFSILY